MKVQKCTFRCSYFQFKTQRQRRRGKDSEVVFQRQILKVQDSEAESQRQRFRGETQTPGLWARDLGEETRKLRTVADTQRRSTVADTQMRSTEVKTHI